MLNRIITTGFKDIVKEEIESLEKKLQTNLDHSLEHFSKDVKTLIADEIVRRYYGDKGGIIYNLREDTDILESYKILGDKEKYNERYNKDRCTLTMYSHFLNLFQSINSSHLQSITYIIRQK